MLQSVTFQPAHPAWPRRGKKVLLHRSCFGVHIVFAVNEEGRDAGSGVIVAASSKAGVS